MRRPSRLDAHGLAIRKIKPKYMMVNSLGKRFEADATQSHATGESEQRIRDLASLRGRDDLLPALDRARRMPSAFAGAPAPEFQGSLHRKLWRDWAA